MNLNELEKFKLSDAIYFHEELNQSIFDGDHLNPKVRQQLLLIAEDFLEHLGVSSFDIEDITLSGSNAAYTYTKHSDVDLHILVDMNQFKDDDVYREFFDAKKVVYNDSHDIKINGYDVELYVQDTNQPVISLGEYSVLNDKWLRLPRKRKVDLDQMAAKLKFQKLYKLAEYAYRSNNFEKIQNVLRTIKKYRQAGLDLNGEFSAENLAFKAMRSKGIIKKLYNKLDDLHSERLSLPESKLLNKPTPTIAQLAKKHKIDIRQLKDQLSQGINVELEHTKNYEVAKEIALDHLSEKPDYYTRLKRAELEENAYFKKDGGWYHSGLGYGRMSEEDKLQPLPRFSMFERNFRHKKGTFEDIFHYMVFLIQKDMFSLYDDKDITGNEIANIMTELYGTNAKEELHNFNAHHKHQWKSWNEIFDAVLKNEIENYRERMVNAMFKESIPESSGYIPSEKEKNDPRFKTALTVDVKPNSIKKNAKAFGFNVSRAGIPPLLRK